MNRITFLLVSILLCSLAVDGQRVSIPVDVTAYQTFGPNNSIWGFDRITIEGTTGITWLKISASGAASGQAWETASQVIFDGVPFTGQQLICPKSPPPCEGCGPQRATELHFFVWGQGVLDVNVTRVTYDNDNMTEGQYINREDPDGKIQGMGSITLDPPNAQAGNDVNVRVLIPSRMLVHVGRVDLILPAPTPQDINRTTRVTLPFDTDGTYDFTWTIPSQYFGQSNVWDVNKGVRFEVFSNKANANGQNPRITSGYTEIKVAGVLQMDITVQGRTVDERKLCPMDV